MRKSLSSPLKSASILSSAGAATDGGATADGADGSATGYESVGLGDGKTGMSSPKTPSGTGFSNDSLGLTKVVQRLDHLESLQPTKAKPFEHQIEPLLESEMNLHG